MKTYRITYRVECFVEAKDEDEAEIAFENGESEGEEYIEMVSIEEVSEDHTPM